MGNENNIPLWREIQDKLNAKVKGHMTLRPALCDLRSLNIEFTTESGKTVKLEAVLWCDYITCTTPSGKRGWIQPQTCTDEELQIVLNAVNLCISREDPDDGFYRGKYLRAINPWWFICHDVNQQMDSILGESYEHYIKKVKGDR